jgi:hypothetical protein
LTWPYHCSLFFSMMSMMFNFPFTPIISFIRSLFILTILDFLDDTAIHALKKCSTVYIKQTQKQYPVLLQPQHHARGRGLQLVYPIIIIVPISDTGPH